MKKGATLIFLFLMFHGLSPAQSVEESLEWLQQKNQKTGFCIKALKSTDGHCYNAQGTGTLVFNENAISALCMGSEELSHHIPWESTYKININAINEVTIVSRDLVTLILLLPMEQEKGEDMQLIASHIRNVIALKGGKLVTD